MLNQIKLLSVSISLLLFQFAICQNKLNNETVFILYENIEKENLKKLMKENSSDFEKSYFIYHYNFFKENNKLDVNNSFQLVFLGINVYKNSQNKEPVFVYINKSFIRKNKDLVLTKSMMNKMSKKSLFTILKQANTIFLIDKNCINGNNKIPLKEVKLETISIE